MSERLANTDSGIGAFEKPAEDRSQFDAEVMEMVGSYTEDIYRWYLAKIGEVDLLTAEDEVRLSRTIEDGVNARAELEEALVEDAYLNSVLQSHGYEPVPMNPVRLQKFEDQIAEGDKARRQFIEANLRLVVSIARRFTGQGLDIEDLTQEGNLGLMRAVDKFDYRKGFKFSTYATWWIRQSIGRAVADSSRNIRIPVHRDEEIRKAMRMRAEFYNDEGRYPTLYELADKMGTTFLKITELMLAAQDTVSLDRTYGDGDDLSLIDTVHDEKHNPFFNPREYTELDLDDLHRLIRKTELNDRERTVLDYRFFEGLTLQDAGQRLGLTRERVRQIEKRAIDKLRHSAGLSPAATKNSEIVPDDPTPIVPGITVSEIINNAQIRKKNKSRNGN